MIRSLFCLLLILSMSVFSIGCGDDDNGGSEGGNGGSDEPSDCNDEEIIDEDISTDTTWDCPVYLLQGKIYVVDDAVLTIKSGVQVLGDTSGSEEAALIVTRGAQLNAIGTADEPIVFSSG